MFVSSRMMVLGIQMDGVAVLHNNVAKDVEISRWP